MTCARFAKGSFCQRFRYRLPRIATPRAEAVGDYLSANELGVTVRCTVLTRGKGYNFRVHPEL
jgi:hypothetical protein